VVNLVCMKTKLSILISVFWLLSICVPAQQTKLVSEIGSLYCDDLLSRADGLWEALKISPGSIAYLVFYEGKHLNKMTGKPEWLNPRYGEGLNNTRAITFYLIKYKKLRRNRFRIISGGYALKYRVQFWIVPKGAKLPKLEGVLNSKDITFRRGKPPKVRDCQAAYDNI